MNELKIKKFFGAILVGLIFFTNFAESQAADNLPKIKIEKPKKISAKKIQDDDKKIFKSDWESHKLFEEKIKHLLEEGELSASSSERIAADKNLIFVGIYKGNFYFLDRYSIEIKKNSETEKSWSQKIFPVGEKIYSKNLTATVQKFSTDTKKFFNSAKFKNELDEIENLEDRNFLRECFKVGCYYAFGEEF